MKLTEQLLQKTRAQVLYKIEHAQVHEQEFVTFQELMISEGKTKKDFSAKAWGLLEQVIQYPFDEFSYFTKEDLPEDPVKMRNDELFIVFLNCLAEVIEGEGLGYDEINALPLGFKVAFYLLPWDERGGFMTWLSYEDKPVDFVREVVKIYTLVGLKKESKAILKALKYADKHEETYDRDKALIAYSYVHGQVGNEVELRLGKINQLLLDPKKRTQLFSM